MREEKEKERKKNKGKKKKEKDRFDYFPRVNKSILYLFFILVFNLSCVIFLFLNFPNIVSIKKKKKKNPSKYLCYFENLNDNNYFDH